MAMGESRYLEWRTPDKDAAMIFAIGIAVDKNRGGRAFGERCWVRGYGMIVRIPNDSVGRTNQIKKELIGALVAIGKKCVPYAEAARQADEAAKSFTMGQS
jgi:hypothetical protein